MEGKSDRILRVLDEMLRCGKSLLCSESLWSLEDKHLNGVGNQVDSRILVVALTVDYCYEDVA